MSGPPRLSLDRQDGVPPPDDIPGHVLFRLLATRPRPVWPLTFRIRAAPGVALFVRGLRGREDAMAFTDGWNEIAPIRDGVAARKVVAIALTDERARPLLTYDTIGHLDEHELHGLAMAVVTGLNVVSPAMWRCNIRAWKDRLKEGAGHFTNMADTMTMAESGEPLYDLGTRQWRPDRYYGAPLCELTDGQILAYDAAQMAYRERIPKAKEPKWPIQKKPPSRL